MADNQKRIEDAAKKVEEANEKVAEARGGNVVSLVSAFGTPSTYEDPQHEAGRAIAKLDDESRTQDLDKFNDDQESLVKFAEERADEEVKAAEAAVASAEAVVDEDEVAKQREEVQSQREVEADKTRRNK